MSKRTSAGVGFALLLLASSAIAAPKPLSETLTGSAKEDYEAAKVLFRDGDFNGAFTKFKSAHAASTDPRLLWNMATCQKALRHYVLVRQYVKAYVADSTDRVSAQDREEALRLLQTIEPFIGTIVIGVSEPEASIFIDEDSVGRSPLKSSVPVDLGLHRVRVAKEGFGESTTNVEIAGPQEKTVTIELKQLEGRVVVTADEGATIGVDGKTVSVTRWESVLPVGAHALHVTASGRKAYDTDIIITAGGQRSIQVHLEKEKSSASPVPWIIGGAVLVVGAGVAAYFIFKPSDTQTANASGNLPPGTIQLP